MTEPNCPSVTLTQIEMLIAAFVGIFRQIENLMVGREDTYGYDGGGFAIHILGCMGEMAYAKFRNVYWSGAGLPYSNGEDVGSVQIRTRSRHDYEMFLDKLDADGDFFVLVTGRAPTFYMRGYMSGTEAKQKGKWQVLSANPEARCFVPTSLLHRFAP